MDNVIDLPLRTLPVRALMGPGPSEIHPRALQALAQPAIGHLDPAFVDLMNEVKELLRYVFQTENRLTFPVSGPECGYGTCLPTWWKPVTRSLLHEMVCSAGE